MAQRFEQFGETFNNSNVFFGELGKSYDSVFFKKRRQILAGKAKLIHAYNSPLKDILKYESATSQEAFKQQLKASASGKASFGLGKLGGSGSYRKFFSSNNFSLYVLAHVRFMREQYAMEDFTIEPNFESFLKKNYLLDKDAIEKEIGDEVITGITTGSEILIKLEIATSSETNKNKIKTSASFSGMFGASGGASFKNLVDNIKEHKSTSISMYGDLPDGKIMENISAGNIEKFVLEYSKLSSERFSIMEMVTMPVRDIPFMIEYTSLLNPPELTSRKYYFAELDVLYQDFCDWKGDIEYVLSNPKEFNSDTLDKAKRNSEECEKYLKEIGKLHDTAFDYWIENGRNGDFFNLSSLKTLMSLADNIPTYVRVEPATPVTKPIVPPKKKKTPSKESSRYNGNHADAHAR